MVETRICPFCGKEQVIRKDIDVRRCNKCNKYYPDKFNKKEVNENVIN